MSNDLIIRKYEESSIAQRRTNGYFDATGMCRAHGKRWDHYFANNGTKEFLATLSASTGIPVTEQNQGLIQVRQGGTPGEQGTWVHPQVAYHLAMWCSPAFAVKVTEWILDLHTHGFTTVDGVGKRSSTQTVDRPTHRPSAQLFRFYRSVGIIAGLDENDATLRAARACEKRTGVNPLADMDVRLLAPVQEQMLTPTNIGQKMGGLSAQAINRLLIARGLQTPKGPGDAIYPTTDRGRSYSRIVDSGKRDSDGRMIQQLLWNEGVIRILRDEPNNDNQVA